MSVQIANSIGMELVLIPPGEFNMGSAESDDHADEEKPQHRIKITKAFRLGKYEVTRGQYACRAGSTTKWCFGVDASRLGDYAWYKGNSNFTMHGVGQKQPNARCLYDIHGKLYFT